MSELIRAGIQFAIGERCVAHDGKRIGRCLGLHCY